MKRHTVVGRNVCKVILLGAKSGGKSTLLCRLLKGVFQPGLSHSFGAVFATKTLQTDKGLTKFDNQTDADQMLQFDLNCSELKSSKTFDLPFKNCRTVMLHIWDTMGEERFRSIVRLYYRDAKAAIICCDVTDSKSFHEAEYWIKELQVHEKSCQVYICGTKMDLVQCGSQALEVSVEDLKMFNGDCFLTSSKTGENVTELFQRIADDFSLTPDFRADCPGMFDSRPIIELSEVSVPADSGRRRCCGSDDN